jgi:hypothetical protein
MGRRRVGTLDQIETATGTVRLQPADVSVASRSAIPIRTGDVQLGIVSSRFLVDGDKEIQQPSVS